METHPTNSNTIVCHDNPCSMQPSSIRYANLLCHFFYFVTSFRPEYPLHRDYDVEGTLVTDKDSTVNPHYKKNIYYPRMRCTPIQHPLLLQSKPTQTPSPPSKHQCCSTPATQIDRKYLQHTHTCNILFDVMTYCYLLYFICIIDIYTSACIIVGTRILSFVNQPEYYLV